MRFLRANALEAVHASRFDAEKKRKGVKCILSCPLWLQTYVSIVNKFMLFYDGWYSNFMITYDVLLIFPRFFDRLKRQILYKLCYKGALHDLIKIHDQFEWPGAPGDDFRSHDNPIFRYACKKGHLEIAQWLYTAFQLTVDDARSNDNFAFRYACIYGHLDMAKWLYTTFQLTIEDVRSAKNHAFRLACMKGRLDVAQWLFTVFHLTVVDARAYDKYAYRWSRHDNHQNVCDWLVATFGESVIA